MNSVDLITENLFLSKFVQFVRTANHAILVFLFGPDQKKKASHRCEKIFTIEFFS